MYYLNTVNYGKHVDINTTSITFEKETIQSNLCSYSDAYILVKCDIMITGGGGGNDIEFNNYAPFTKFRTHIGS